jgi:hypothetical protein
MQTHPLSLSTQEYSILGRLCASQKPDVARQLLSIFDTKPSENDHSRISAYFESFCILQDVNPEEYRGGQFKTQKVDVHRLFIACMVRMYAPYMYQAPPGIRLKKGFSKSLSKTLGQKVENISKMVREGIVQEKVYPEFRAAVDDITNKLKIQ